MWNILESIGVNEWHCFGMLLVFHSYLHSDVSCREAMLIDQTQFLKSEMRKLERSRYTVCNLFERILLCALCMHVPFYIYLCKHVMLPHFP